MWRTIMVGLPEALLHSSGKDSNKSDSRYKKEPGVVDVKKHWENLLCVRHHGYHFIDSKSLNPWKCKLSDTNLWLKFINPLFKSLWLSSKFNEFKYINFARINPDNSPTLIKVLVLVFKLKLIWWFKFDIRVYNKS